MDLRAQLDAARAAIDTPQDLSSTFTEIVAKEKVYSALLGKDVDATRCQGLVGKELNMQCTNRPEKGFIFCGHHRGFLEKGLLLLEQRRRAEEAAMAYQMLTTQAAIKEADQREQSIRSVMDRTGMSLQDLDSTTQRLRDLRFGGTGSSPFATMRSTSPRETAHRTSVTPPRQDAALSQEVRDLLSAGCDLTLLVGAGAGLQAGGRPGGAGAPVPAAGRGGAAAR